MIVDGQYGLSQRAGGVVTRCRLSDCQSNWRDEDSFRIVRASQRLATSIRGFIKRLYNNYSVREEVAAYSARQSGTTRHHGREPHKQGSKQDNAHHGDEFDAESGILGPVQDAPGRHHVFDSHCARNMQYRVAAVGGDKCSVGVV